MQCNQLPMHWNSWVVSTSSPHHIISGAFFVPVIFARVHWTTSVWILIKLIVILILMSIDKFLNRWVGVAMDGNMTLTISTGLEKLQLQIVVVNHCYQIDHDHVRLWWWSWYKVLAHSSEPWYKNMTMPTIVMTKTLIRSAVTDNDWVCQMDWVPALSQVNRLPYSKIKNMKKKKKQGNLLGVGAFVAKSLSLVNILPWGSAWYAPLWLAQVSFFFRLWIGLISSISSTI